jgi:hypothetical protein
MISKSELTFSPYLATQFVAGRLREIRRENYRLYVLICELVDNAFDAGATNIWIQIDLDKREFVIEDNGQGFSDIRLALDHGASISSLGMRYGRYGIGLKVTAIALANLLDIISRNPTHYVAATGNYNEMAKKNEWEYETAEVELSAKEKRMLGETRSVVTLKELDPEKLTPEAVAELPDHLSKIYGRKFGTTKINFNGTELKPIEIELESGAVTKDVTVNGRAYKVRAGIAKNKAEANGKVSVYYDGRLLREYQPLFRRGLTEYGFHCDVEVIDGKTAESKWELTGHKDGLTEFHWEQLRNSLETDLVSLIRDMGGKAQAIRLTPFFKATLAPNLGAVLMATVEEVREIKGTSRVKSLSVRAAPISASLNLNPAPPVPSSSRSHSVLTIFPGRRLSRPISRLWR